MQTPHTSAFVDDIRALPRAFWSLQLGLVLSNLTSFVWPFFAIYMGRHGSSLSDVSLIISAGGVGGLLGNLFGGWLCDRIGRRHSLFSGAMVNSVILISLYSFPPLALLICLAFLGGASYGVTRAASDSLMTDIVPLALRVRSQAVLKISVNFGVGVGMVLGAEVAGHSAFWLFAGAAIATACYGAIALFALPHGVRTTKEEARWSIAFAQMSKDGPFKAYVVALALGLTSFFMVLSPMALHLAIHNVTLDAFGFHFSPENMFSLAIAWTCILVGVLGLPIAAWSRNFNPRRALACGFLLVGLGTGILGITYSPVGILVAMSVYALGENLSLPVAAAYLAKLSPPAMRGRYIGVASLSWNFAIIAAPQIGVRFIKSSPGFVWGTCVALGVASAAVLLLFGREEAKAAHVALPLPEPVSV